MSSASPPHTHTRPRASLRAVLLGVLLVCAPPLAPAIFAEPFVFEDAEVSTVVKHVSRLTGITFLFDPAQVKGKITVLAPGSVSATEALELLTAALAVHGYRLVAGTAAMWVVPVERLAPEAVVVEIRSAEEQHTSPLQSFGQACDHRVVVQVVDPGHFDAERRSERCGLEHEESLGSWGICGICCRAGAEPIGRAARQGWGTTGPPGPSGQTVTPAFSRQR